MIPEMGRADLMGPCLCIGERGSDDRRLRDLGLRLAVLAAGLVAAAGALPTVAQAAIPSVATRSVDVTASETAIVQGDAEPRGPQTAVYIAYGLATGTWCATQGYEGTATQTTPAVLGSGETIYEVSITVGGLDRETAYCAELVAENQDGTAYGGQVGFTTLADSAFPSEPSSPTIPENKPTPFVSEPPAWIGGSVGATSQRLVEAAESRRREEAERAAQGAHEREAKDAAEQHSTPAVPRCVVPRLQGEPLNEARAALRTAHCRLGTVTKMTRPREDLVVVAQGAHTGRVLSADASVSVKLGPRAPTKTGPKKTRS
jgi:hypothetical protein